MLAADHFWLDILALGTAKTNAINRSLLISRPGIECTVVQRMSSCIVWPACLFGSHFDTWLGKLLMADYYDPHWMWCRFISLTSKVVQSHIITKLKPRWWHGTRPHWMSLKCNWTTLSIILYLHTLFLQLSPCQPCIYLILYNFFTCFQLLLGGANCSII